MKDEKQMFLLEELEQEPWEIEWQNMPEFLQLQVEPYAEITIRFRDELDYKKFAELIEQNLTPLTKSVWYPAFPKFRNKYKRYIDES